MSSKICTCPICGDPMALQFQEILLGRHQVGYMSCSGCGLLQTEPPFWLEEAYRRPIASEDTGLVARNLENCRFLETFLPLAFPVSAKFLDLGGGYGLLTRLLRDRGFDGYSTDPHCRSLFAGVHEPGSSFEADALFAFEVLEHLSDPLSFLEEAFARHGCRVLIFSTLTFHGAPPSRDWWYYAFESGQHISFYQKRTLARLAERLGCTYRAVHDGLHVMHRDPLPCLARWALGSKLARHGLAMLVRMACPRKSLTWDDHVDCLRQQRAHQESKPHPEAAQRA